MSTPRIQTPPAVLGGTVSGGTVSGRATSDRSARAPSAEAQEPRRGAVRPEVAEARRVVIKLGTRVLVNQEGALAEARVQEVVQVAAELCSQGRQVMLVSSGAVGLGRHILGLDEPPENPSLRRACAAAGQSQLMTVFGQGFAGQGRVAAQVLLTENDFGERRRYLDLRSTLERLLENGIVPVLNENDAVSHGQQPCAGSSPKAVASRVVFQDNDRLASLVAAKCRADLLILLTDVEGVYDRDPRKFDSAALLHRVDDPRAVLEGIDESPGSDVGRGGMRSKVEAARVAAQGGCHVVIASGRQRGTLARVVAGHSAGTFFQALGALPARRRWIAFAAAAKGELHIDAGAVVALRERRASLLPVGVVRIEGRFERGDVVELRGPDGALVGRGLMSYDAEQARQWCAGQAPDCDRQPNCLLRRTHVVLEN